MPRVIQEEIIAKKIRFYLIDAYKVARENSMGRKINTIMQTCFFAISGVLLQEEAMVQIKNAIRKSYGSKGDDVVALNYRAVESTLAHLEQVAVPAEADSTLPLERAVKGELNSFVKEVTAALIERRGDELPVSRIPADGTWPSGTTQYEKRNIAQEIPLWDPEACIQCNKCVLVCPHAVIRSKVADEALLQDAPEGFFSIPAKGRHFGEEERFTIQVSVEDCTGCALCVEVCPGKSKTDPERKAINMTPKAPLLEAGVARWDYFRRLPSCARDRLNHTKVKESQLLEPLFEFSGACPGCGETPYIKLATQLFGDRMMVANATGCSSIYGGNLPTTPWTKNKEGRGPAWSNSLFEDNAEFGLGFRLTIDKHTAQAKELLEGLSEAVDGTLAAAILEAQQQDETQIDAQRQRVARLKTVLKNMDTPQAEQLLELADYLVKKSVWIIGGDGWAYDIGYGGLDHVLAGGRNVNILVLDTQVYSNTGGQQSKATPTGAVAKFASGGKPQLPKDLAMMAVAYGNVYVARVAMGADDTQTLKAFMEAERYEGPSIIIAYAHCIAHGYDLRYGMQQQKKAVACGLWPLFRYDPQRTEEGKNPMQLDYKGPQIPVKEYMYGETRFSSVAQMSTAHASDYLKTAQEHAEEMYRRYRALAQGDDL
jgi:pyruvate-ferredoxin/flavodoxin oxidoreductase